MLDATVLVSLRYVLAQPPGSAGERRSVDRKVAGLIAGSLPGWGTYRRQLILSVMFLSHSGFPLRPFFSLAGPQVRIF